MVKLEIPTVTLNDGNKMPGIGMGCWMGKSGEAEESKKTTSMALKLGYRHLDTAASYGNEEVVAKAIRESGLPREEIYVTTKLLDSQHRPEEVVEGFERSLKLLELDYIDLYLMHWPMSKDATTGRVLSPEESPTFVETWYAMEGLLSTGKVKSIGVSNFSIKTLDVLLPRVNVVPSVNQVELNPCFPSDDLVEYCKSKSIVVTAYTPMGRAGAPFYTDPMFLRIAEKHNTTVGQVLLSWAVQRGTVPIPKSSNETRAEQNINLIKLSGEDMAEIGNFHKKPGMHRTLCHIHNLKNGLIFGWTPEQLGWGSMDSNGVLNP